MLRRHVLCSMAIGALVLAMPGPGGLVALGEPPPLADVAAATTTTTMPVPEPEPVADPAAPVGPPPTTTTTIPTTTSTTLPRPAAAPGPTPTTTTLPAVTTTTMAAFADRAAAADHVALVDRSRKEAGLAGVAASTTLAAAAEDWAREIAARGKLVHSDLTRIGGFAWKGENLAAGSRSAATIHDLWMGSSGHRANILNERATHAGAGVWVASDGSVWHVLLLGG